MRKINFLALIVALVVMASSTSTAFAHAYVQDREVNQVQQETEKEDDVYIYYDQYGNVIEMEEETGIAAFAFCFIHKWEYILRYNTVTKIQEYNYRCSGCGDYYYASWTPLG